MASEPLLETLTGLLSDFNRRGVDYALAGGWAFSALVEPRATTDIDVLIVLDQPSQEAIQSLLSSVFESTIVHPTPMRLQGITMWRGVGVRHEQEVVVDFLLADSDFLRGALTRKHRIELGALPVSVLTVEDLMLLKMIAGRLQDQADLEKITARQGELQIDWAYVDRWKAALRID